MAGKGKPMDPVLCGVLTGSTLWGMLLLQDRSLVSALQQRCGLPVSQLEVLVTLEEQPMTVGRLAECTHTAGPNMTALTRKMCADQLIAKAQDPGDRRRILLMITPRGREVMDQARQIAGERVNSWSERLSAAEMKQLNTAMGTVVRLLRIAGDR